MSEPFLRPTAPGDLPALSELTESVFGRRRSPELLRWLLLEHAPGNGLSSRVAVRDGAVLGHVAFLQARYRWGGRQAVGVHPLLLLASPEGRGRAGVLLARWCASHGDFSLVLGGTGDSRRVMERRRFGRAATGTELRLAAGGTRAAGGRWSLERYEAGAAAEPPADGPALLDPSPQHLAWLAASPRHDGLLFTACRDGEPRGPVLLFVNRRAEPARGRVVHLPWAGDGVGELLRLALAALARAGCATASYLATSRPQLDAALALGGEPFYERPLYFRDQAGLPPPPGWHLSYAEGDLAYRRV